jgi:hypothetical protein
MDSMNLRLNRRVASSVFQLTLFGWCLCPLLLVGCKNGYQYARVVKPGEREMVGSHQAGQETFRPLIEESVAKLLSRCETNPTQLVSTDAAPHRYNVCFVGVENASIEEMGDFKEQVYEAIDTKIRESGTFQTISRRFVDAGLHECRMRPDQLMIPDNMRQFVGVMEQEGHPFEYLLFAKLTSGTTRENKEYQRDYLLTLELVNIHNGISEKQSAELKKGYHTSRMSRWGASVWPFSQ